MVLLATGFSASHIASGFAITTSDPPRMTTSQWGKVAIVLFVAECNMTVEFLMELETSHNSHLTYIFT